MIKRLFGAVGILLLVAVSSKCTGPDEIDLIYQVQADVPGITADIEYLKAENDTVRVEGATLTWQKNLDTNAGKPVYIKARSNSPNEVTITVSIFINGQLFRFDRQKGIFVIATTSGIVDNPGLLITGAGIN